MENEGRELGRVKGAKNWQQVRMDAAEEEREREKREREGERVLKLFDETGILNSFSSF